MPQRKSARADRQPSKSREKPAKAAPKKSARAPRTRADRAELARPPAGSRAASPVEISQRLARAVPEAACELRFESAFQLVIATILSAQSTDKAVNAVTPALFTRFPTPAKLAAADPDEVETLIKRTGFFRAKTKSIRGAAQKLVDEFGGEVPRTLPELTTLPGVARKTANVVLGTAYRIPSGFVVDTHVSRVAQRLALTSETDPAKIERDLCAAFPQEQWIDLGHRVLLHGRYTCLARAPMCEACPLNELCPARLARAEGEWPARADAEAARVRAGMAG